MGEAKAMIDAVRHNKRIVQIGTQHRSADHIAEAAKMVQSGKIGEVHFVRVWNYMGTPWQSAPVPDSEPPADLNWDAWLGPAPTVPFNRNRLNYRSFMDYTNGIITDYGNHRFDSVHQIMGVETAATSGLVLGARGSTKTTAGDIYDMQTGDLRISQLHHELRGLQLQRPRPGRPTAGMRYYGMRGAEDRPHGMAFYGTEAALFVDRIGMELYPEPKFRRRRAAGRGGQTAAWAPPEEKITVNEDEPTPLHTKNFRGFRARRKEPFANIEVGVRATTIGVHRERCLLDGPQAEVGRENATSATTRSQSLPLPPVSQTVGPGEVQLAAIRFT